MTRPGPYRPASWRGVPFGVWDADGAFGRATAVHEYPFRDSVWVEDLGRATRKLGLRGFLVGDDVAALEAEMIEAAEAEGPGQLMHPTLGPLKASLVEFRSTVRHDLGRVVELHFTFIENGAELFPLAGLAPGARVESLAGALDAAAAGDFARAAGDALRGGAAVVRQVQTAVGQYTRIASGLIGDARAVLNVAGLVVPGVDRAFGRFTAGYRNALSPVGGTLRTVDGGLAALGSARRRVADGVDRVTRLAARL
ncbi:DNA circularization N-terminal domain-containing protein [Falsiroseomonas sp. CW058]|uniref:DNA circularization N-terminal domain-containing protein n=1 Tax=Falsiroseomonas sp. CW058 TaxID=3388664 RepID=UPI003D313A89